MKEKLIENIEKEKEIVKELLLLSEMKVSEEEKEFLEEAIRSLIAQLKILSFSVSKMLKKEEKGERIITERGVVFLDKKLKENFLRQINIEKEALKKIRKEIKKEEIKELKKPSFFVIFSSLVFGRIASRLIKKGYYEDLKKNLQKANMPFLTSSYVSLAFFITFFVFVISIAVALSLSTSATIIRNIVIAIALSIGTFILIINYPSVVASSIKTKIEDELPFAVSHMSAIASSRVEPSKIFFVMAKVKEYPYFSQEAKKVVNQINLYGYDLVTSLKNVAKNCASEKLSELFEGIATTTKTGGSLVKYLEEKSKDLLLDYKLKREKYIEAVGVMSDIYTALLIAAPLILMLILTVMGFLGSSIAGIGISKIAWIGIFLIIILNVLFLIFIHLTQPKT